ncbi:MAG TPA: aminoacyl-tRNA hydrolase [Actinomycetota bacterium]|nr:aminoacyl-tRNA hydrolase [Actinomycetota bacterium]
MTEQTWLVVGLGNPGPRYEVTRHNIGAWVADRLADRLRTRLRKVRFLPLEVAETSHAGARLYLARPQTFMNESGPPVASFTRRRRLDPGSIVACHDEIDLSFGALKLKRGGSTAGHNGLNSLVNALHSPDFYRVRLGVGRPRGRQDPADYVLEPFARSEREEAELLAEEGADAVLTLVADGLKVAQDRHNRAAPRT